ncbi:hypothetical protein [uncultured Tateyamaria sp.]|uniref:hypothetical protein n=1 Tax=uncultured Tateyamaria sp. TaxID=455651 RepID=UPI002627B3BB|nr:hypothetical protein [uncultured Tateyamaria sp.]
MTVSDKDLMAYADGALTGTEHARVAAAVMKDPDLRARLDVFKRSTELAQSAMPLEDVPEALKERIRATVEASENSATDAGDNTIAPLKPAVWTGQSAWLGAIAASLVLGVGLGAFLLNPNENDPTAFDLAPVVTILETAASGTSVAHDGVDTRLIASFEAGDGAFCREFEARLEDRSDLIGVGCRTDTGWELRFAAAVELTDDTQFAPASALEVLEAWMRNTEAGPVMSVEEEAKRLSDAND